MNEICLTTEHRGGSRSTTFSGRSEGKDVRKALNLDILDQDEEVYLVKIPNDTTSFNPSFFLGLFFQSLINLGDLERFTKKYKIDLSNYTDEEWKNLIQEDIDDCIEISNKELNDYNTKTK